MQASGFGDLEFGLSRVFAGVGLRVGDILGCGALDLGFRLGV